MRKWRVGDKLWYEYEYPEFRGMAAIIGVEAIGYTIVEPNIWGSSNVGFESLVDEKSTLYTRLSGLLLGLKTTRLF